MVVHSLPCLRCVVRSHPVSVGSVTRHHVVECRSCQWHHQLFQPHMSCAPDAFTLSRYVFNHKDQHVLAQALHEVCKERKAMLANQPLQQPQQVLQCPRMTADVTYCQEQQRRRDISRDRCHQRRSDRCRWWSQRPLAWLIMPNALRACLAYGRGCVAPIARRQSAWA
jgi:hypothetical protein